jgi:hypothetical protein
VWICSCNDGRSRCSGGLAKETVTQRGERFDGQHIGQRGGALLGEPCFGASTSRTASSFSVRRNELPGARLFLDPPPLSRRRHPRGLVGRGENRDGLHTSRWARRRWGRSEESDVAGLGGKTAKQRAAPHPHELRAGGARAIGGRARGC